VRVLVTGAGGFVGARLARLLTDRGHQVAGTYLADRPALPGVALHEADLRDRAALARAVAAADPEVVVHLAGLSHVGESWDRMPEYVEVNVGGTANVLAAAAAGGGRRRRVIVASSAEAYGVVPEAEQPIREERPLDPCSPYGVSKLATERLALPLGAVVMRPFNMVGPGQAPSFALPSFASQLAAIARGEQREAVLRVGNLTARRDFVHVDDGAEALLVLCERGEPGRAYNVATGRATSIREALERLQRISGVRAEVVEDPARMRPVDLPLLVGDSGRLRALGWTPRRTLDDALAGLWAAVWATAGAAAR
jgi:GDP-4-dehydro-6-deoxy-D-mannose reductase